MVMDFGRHNQNLEDVLGSMEDMANDNDKKVVIFSNKRRRRENF